MSELTVSDSERGTPHPRTSSIEEAQKGYPEKNNKTRTDSKPLTWFQDWASKQSSNNNSKIASKLIREQLSSDNFSPLSPTRTNQSSYTPVILNPLLNIEREITSIQSTPISNGNEVLRGMATVLVREIDNPIHI